MRLGLNPATVTRLRLVVAPFAAGALAVATDCDAATLAGLHLDHVATDGATAQAGIIPPRAAATPTWQGTAPTFTPGLDGGAQVIDLRLGPSTSRCT